MAQKAKDAAAAAANAFLDGAILPALPEPARSHDAESQDETDRNDKPEDGEKKRS